MKWVNIIRYESSEWITTRKGDFDVELMNRWLNGEVQLNSESQKNIIWNELEMNSSRGRKMILKYDYLA